MALGHLEVTRFRNIQRATITPNEGINFLCGPNGSGKTSILEAIHCLGRGKSFRTHLTNQLISRHHDRFTVAGKINRAGRTVPIGFTHSKTANEIRVGGKTINTAAQLASELPIALIEPGSHSLISGSPANRRRYLDWGVFHVEQGFHMAWHRYRKALAQRNAAIKSGWTEKTVKQWDQELVSAALVIDRLRREYLETLSAAIKPVIASFFVREPIVLEYHSGWKKGLDYGTYLAEHLRSDMERGFTQFGPHRAELRIQTSVGPAKDILSRGQQKLCMTSLILGQCRLLEEQGKEIILLIDDLAAELDHHNRATFLEILSHAKSQVFITGTEDRLFQEIHTANKAMFHVEQGEIRPADAC